MVAATEEGRIAELLLQHVENNPEGFPVAHPDVAFNPPGAETGNLAPYLEVTHVPNGFVYSEHGDGRTYQGLLQVAVMVPSGQGVIKQQDIAGEIRNHFAKGTRLFGDGVTVCVIDHPAVNQSLPDDGFTKTPVVIRYQAN